MQIKDLMERASKAYYDGKPFLTNEQYDALEQIHGQIISGNGDVAGTLDISGGSTNGVAISQGAIAIKNGGSKSRIDLYCESSNAHYARLQSAAHSAYSGNITITLPASTGTLALTSSDITGTAAVATAVTVSANNSTDETVYPLFVDGATGTQGAETDTGLSYNPSSGNLTIGGELAAATLDISGNVDIDGTLEADAITVNGTTLAETISDTVGAMVTSNTETGITVAYQDADNTLDFTIGTLNQDTTGTADNITVSANNSTDETVYPIFVDGATGSQGAESDTGLTYNPSSGVLTATQFTGNLTGNVTGNTSGTAATVTGAAQSNITSLGTLTTLTVDNVIINGTTIGHTSDTDLMTLADGVLTVAGEVSMTTLDIGGTNVTSTAAELNILDGVTASATDINLIDGITNGTVIASKAIITDSNKDITGGRNITITGELDAATLDISGDIDVDGTANLDNTDIDGTLNVSGVVTAQTSANLNEVALTDGTVSWDAAAAANATLLLEENSTIAAPDNPVAGAIISIEVAQHASSGPYTLAWNSVFQFAGGTTPTMTATDAKTDIYTFRYNGSKWQNIGVTQNLTQS